MADKEMKKGVLALDSKDQVNGIQDDQFFYTKDEIEAVRLHRTMYIFADQTDGAMHLIREIVNNAIDEACSKTPIGIELKENSYYLQSTGKTYNCHRQWQRHTYRCPG